MNALNWKKKKTLTWLEYEHNEGDKTNVFSYDSKVTRYDLK